MLNVRYFLCVLAGLLLFGFAEAHAWAPPVEEQPAEMPKWYAGISGSVTFLKDSPITSHDLTPGSFSVLTTNLFEVGYTISGNVGYRFSPFIRADIEVSQQVNDPENRTPVAGMVPEKEAATYLMSNLYLDIPTDSDFTPYFGAGVGVARVSVPNSGILMDGFGTVVEQHQLVDWVFAYQLMAGTSYRLMSTRHTVSELYMGYRYTAANGGEVEFKTIPDYGVRFDHAAHNVEIGLRTSF